MFDVDQMIELATVAVATWAPRVFGALAVLVFGWVFAGWIRGFAQEALKRSPLDDILIPFDRRMIEDFLALDLEAFGPRS